MTHEFPQLLRQRYKALGYPVFTGGTICAHAYCHILHVAVPVRVGGLVVHQGDLLHGDANGVSSIPVEIAKAVADIGDEFVAAEEIVMDYVKGTGKKTVAGVAGVRKEYMAVAARLAKRAQASM